MTIYKQCDEITMSESDLNTHYVEFQPADGRIPTLKGSLVDDNVPRVPSTFVDQVATDYIPDDDTVIIDGRRSFIGNSNLNGVSLVIFIF